LEQWKAVAAVRAAFSCICDRISDIRNVQVYDVLCSLRHPDWADVPVDAETALLGTSGAAAAAAACTQAVSQRRGALLQGTART